MRNTVAPYPIFILFIVSDISLAGRPKAASTPAVGASERKLFKFPSETPVVNGKFSVSCFLFHCLPMSIFLIAFVKALLYRVGK